MSDLLLALVTIAVSIGGLLLVLGVLYTVARRLPSRWREGAQAWVFILPALFLLLIGVIVPAFQTIYVSFLNNDRKKISGPNCGWNGKFCFLDNYKTIFTTNDTRLTVINSLTWVVVGMVFTVVVGLTVARFADGMRGEKWAKSAIFIPGAISLVGSGIIWRFVYADNSEQGLLNAITKAVPGLPKSMGGQGTQNWVLERGFGGIEPPRWAPGFNTFLLIIIFIWASAGFATVVFAAAIKGVPESLIEAAKVDGATNRQAFYKVTLPYIRATIITVATTTTIAGLKAFDIIAAVSGGRFGTSTIANEFYVVKFVQSRDGLASALAVIIFILVIPVVVINRRAQSRAEELMGA